MTKLGNSGNKSIFLFFYFLQKKIFFKKKQKKIKKTPLETN